MVRAARIALALYLLGIAAVTLGRRPEGLFDRGLRAVMDLSGGLLSPAAVEAGANVAMFVPLGFLLCRSFPRAQPWLLWALCATASLALELWQWTTPDRDATPRDVIMNSLGAALGVLLSRVVDAALDSRRARRSDRTPRG